MKNKEIMRMNSNKKMRKVVDAIVQAAEKSGGVHNLDMCGGKLKWRNSVVSGCLWYNTRNDGSTHLIKVEEK